MTNFKWPHWMVAALLYAGALAYLGHPNLADDSQQYYHYGVNLLSTGIYGTRPGIPDMQREPGYGTFLAAVLSPLHLAGVDLSSEAALPWIVFCQALVCFGAFFLFAHSPAIPQKFRRLLFLICILSPTIAGTNTVIYSETFALSAFAVFFYFLSRCLVEDSIRNAVLAGVFAGITILTKANLKYALLPLFLFGAGALLWGRLKKSRAPNKFLYASCIAIALMAGGLNQIWEIRNQNTFGPEASVPRFSIAIAGKVGRVHSFDFPRELPIALITSVGTNLCISMYSAEQCEKFEMRGADRVGFQYIAEYSRRYPNAKEAEKHLTRDMIALYFKRPGLQLVGSLLEAIRIFFVEAPQRFGSKIFGIGVPGLSLFPKLWHFFGSLLVWALAITGLWIANKDKKISPEFRAFLGFHLAFVIYHFATMVQVTNLVRYSYQLLPSLYLFAAVALVALKRKAARER